jgi:hypothetical protein
VRVLTTLSERKEPLHVGEILQITSLNRGVVYDVLPVLGKLGLIGKKLGNHKIFITPVGEEFVAAIKNEEKEKVISLGSELIRKSKVLEEAYKILKEEDLNYDELGLRLADKFGKKWHHPFTYRVFGRSCVDILSSFNLIQRKVRRYRVLYFGSKIHEKVLFPTAGTDFIFSMLKIFKEKQVNDASPLIRTTRQKENFKAIIDLGLVKRIGENKFELTEGGRQLKNAIGTKEENRIFRSILLKYSPALDAVNILKEEKGEEEFSIWDLADVIKKYNGSNWSKETGKVYAYKFLSWLKEANVIENGSYGRYRLTKDYDKLELYEKEEVIEEEMEENYENLEEELKKNDADGIFPLDNFYIKIRKEWGIPISPTISKIVEEPELKGKTFKAEITIKEGIALIKLLREQ